MRKSTRFVAMDIHKATITVAIASKSISRQHDLQSRRFFTGVRDAARKDPGMHGRSHGRDLGKDREIAPE